MSTRHQKKKCPKEIIGEIINIYPCIDKYIIISLTMIAGSIMLSKNNSRVYHIINYRKRII